MSDSDKDDVFNFPCLFPIKAMGKAEDDFELLIVEIVRRHVPDLGEGAMKTRLSGNGKYVSVTANITAHSRAQLDALYTELSGHEKVLMVL
jgi:putative lipoic acid-binding regulatory protein